MNRKQLSILIVLLVVIGGLGLNYLKKDKAEFTSSGGALGQKLLDTFQVNDVAQVVITQDKQAVTLVKQDDLWRVKERQDYPANFTTIGDVIRKAADLKVVQTEQIGASQLARMELVEPGKGEGSGTLVELKDKGGKAIRSMLLGKKQVRKSDTPSPFGGGGDFPVGRWITTSAKPGVASLVSETFNEAEPKADQSSTRNFSRSRKCGPFPSPPPTPPILGASRAKPNPANGSSPTRARARSWTPTSSRPSAASSRVRPSTTSPPRTPSPRTPA